MTFTMVTGAIMLILMFASSCSYFYYKGTIDGMELVQKLDDEYIGELNGMIERFLENSKLIKEVE